MRKFLISLTVLIHLTCWISANAEDAEPLQNNVLVENQVNRLSTELRCLVCQNQTLADSHSGLAEDLRQEIRTMAANGMSDQAIIDYLTSRYGDFVRYRPPFKSTTLLLWLGPFILLLVGVFAFFLLLRKRESLSEEASLSDHETLKIKQLLDEES